MFLRVAPSLINIKAQKNFLSNNRGSVKFLSHLCTGKAKANSLAGSS